MSRYTTRLVCFIAFLFCGWLPTTGHADDLGHDRHHQHHRGMNAEQTLTPPYVRSVHRYQIPTVTLLDQDGESANAAQFLDRDGPVFVNIIYTSCTSVCPIMTSTFAQARHRLGADAARITMLSITNDPGHDTPRVLKNYARSHRASERWRFLTGDEQAIAQLLRAFDAYRGGKMNHVPLTFLRTGREQPWVRIEGLASAQQLVSEYRKLVD